MIPRIIEANEDQRIAACTMAILSIPRDHATKTEALVIFPGVNGLYRIGQGLSLYKQFENSPRLIIPGIHKKLEGGWSYRLITDQNMSEFEAYPYRISFTSEVHIQGYAAHTGEQAEWIADIIRREKIRSMTIVASPFHITRAYLTVLTALAARELKVICIPYIPAMCVTVDQSEFGIGANQLKLFPGEMRRIETYPLLAEYIESRTLERYLDWLWAQYDLPLHWEPSQ